MGLKGVADGCKLIESLHINWCRGISDAGLKAIFEALGSRLLRLHLGWSKATNLAISALSTHCPAIQELHLNTCREIDNESCTPLFLNARSLVSLRLTDVNIDDSSIQALCTAKDCVPLLELHLSDLEKLSDAGVVQFASKCSSLTKLNLSHCKQLSLASINALLSPQSHLTSLSLNYQDAVDDSILGGLSCGASLENVLIDGIKKVGDEGLQGLVNVCPKLKRLVAYNTGLTEAGIKAIYVNNPRLVFKPTPW